MAKEDKSLVGEISTIRNILMGQQISEFQQKFDAVSEKSNDLESYMNKKMETLEKDFQSRVTELEKGMNNRLDRLEKLLNDNVSNLEQKISNSSKSDKKLLGQMLKEVSSRLLDE